MKYVRNTPNASGAYPGPRDTPFAGCYPLTNSQAEMLVQHNGFVTITPEPDKDIKGSTVTVTVNTEAWEAWKAEEAEKPEPEPPAPTLDERVTALETEKANQMDVDELNAALNMILTGVTE